MEGCITEIQHFCLHDGPGVRTTVFFAGCNLACRWCHNPEAISPAPRLQYLAARCTGCGACVAACPARAIDVKQAGSSGAMAITDASATNPASTFAPNRALCTGCGACVAACPAGARSLSCQTVTSDEILPRLLADREIYRHTGGGITFSGGEPFLQPDFLKALAQGCQNAGVHTAAETAANLPWRQIKPLLPLLDLVICDLKAASPALHKRCTGADNAQILANIRLLHRHAKQLWVRIPLVPGYNDAPAELAHMANLLKEIGPLPVEVLAYHSMGEGKYQSLGLASPTAGLQPPSAEQLAAAQRLFADAGFPAVEATTP